MEEISFNRSDSIVVQISAENERIEGLSENEKISFNLHSSLFLTGIEVERDFGKNSIQWRKSRYCSDVYGSEISDERRMLAMLSEERASNRRKEYSFWKCRQSMGMRIVVMGIYSDVYDGDYGYDAFDDG